MYGIRPADSSQNRVNDRFRLLSFGRLSPFLLSSSPQFKAAAILAGLSAAAGLPFSAFAGVFEPMPAGKRGYAFGMLLLLVFNSVP